MTEKKDFGEVSKINEPGKYRFTKVSGWNGAGGVAYISIFGEHPTFEYGSIQHHLAEKFQNITLQKFYGASLDDGKYTPASFKFVPKWNEPLSIDCGDYLIHDGEICFIRSDWTRPGDNVFSNFEIKDVGNLSIEENKIVVDKPIGRDGNLELQFECDALDHTKSPKHWRAYIDLEGEDPGKLVKEVIDYINSEKERLEAPLWKFLK